MCLHLLMCKLEPYTPIMILWKNHVYSCHLGFFFKSIYKGGRGVEGTLRRLQPADMAAQRARRRAVWAHAGMHGQSVLRKRAPTKTRRRRLIAPSWKVRGGISKCGP